MIRAIGIDMAFANVGLCRVEIASRGPACDFGVLDLQLLQTEQGNRKVVRASSDNLRRAKELHDGLMAFIGDAQFAFAEVPSGAKSAAAGWGLAMATGILACLPIPVIEVSPMEVKVAVTGKRLKTGVPKSEVIAWAVKRFPDAPWIRHARPGKGYSKGDLQNVNEHLADAVASVAAGIATPEFQRLLSFDQSISHATPSAPRSRPASGRKPLV